MYVHQVGTKIIDLVFLVRLSRERPTCFYFRMVLPLYWTIVAQHVMVISVGRRVYDFDPTSSILSSTLNRPQCLFISEKSLMRIKPTTILEILSCFLA